MKNYPRLSESAHAFPRAAWLVLAALALLVLQGCAETTSYGFKPQGFEFRTLSMSPDGRWAAVGLTEYDSRGNGRYETFLELFRVTTEGWTPVSRHIAWGTVAAWSADGTLLMFKGRNGPIVMDASSGEVRRLAASGALYCLPQWLPNGRENFCFVCTKYFVECVDGNLMAVGLADGRARLIVESVQPLERAVLSHDGQWIAYRHTSPLVDCGVGRPIMCDRSPIYARSSGGGDERMLAREGIPITWSPDGKFLWFATDAPKPGWLSLRRVALSNGRVETVLEEVDVELPFGDPRNLWDSEGRRLALKVGNRIVIIDNSGKRSAEYGEECHVGANCRDHKGDLAWTSDGNGILYFRREGYYREGAREGGIYHLDLRSGRTTPVLADSLSWRKVP